MTFRDDHDAALARNDALARELEAAEEKVEAKEAELAKANSDRVRLEAEVAELRANKPAPTKPPELPVAEPAAVEEVTATSEVRYSTGPVLFFLSIVALFVLIVVMKSGSESKKAQHDANPTCTLRTKPAGATILVTHRDPVLDPTSTRLKEGPPTTQELGVTPLAKTRFEWLAHRDTLSIQRTTWEARYPGYRPLQVRPPINTQDTGCSSQVFELEPE